MMDERKSHTPRSFSSRFGFVKEERSDRKEYSNRSSQAPRYHFREILKAPMSFNCVTRRFIVRHEDAPVETFRENRKSLRSFEDRLRLLRYRSFLILLQDSSRNELSAFFTERVISIENCSAGPVGSWVSSTFASRSCARARTLPICDSDLALTPIVVGFDR